MELNGSDRWNVVVRETEIQEFIAHAGWAEANRQPMAGDASHRRYERLQKSSTATAILMDAPPHTGEDVGRFAAITAHLRTLGLAAPEIFAADLDGGLLLLEDLGDDLVARVATRYPGTERECYQHAVEVLVKLHSYPPPPNLDFGNRSWPIPPYDQDALWREAALLVEWWLPAATGQTVPTELLTEYQALLTETWQEVAGNQNVLVLRDYHAENLVWLPNRQNGQQIGLLDYQDALAGHPAYDLVSLLEDARRDLDPQLPSILRSLYAERTGVELPERERFDVAFAVLGTQRNLKIIGIFTRLWLRDGKPNYLSLIPRVWDHLIADLQHPRLTELFRWVTAHVPAPSEATLQQVYDAGPRIPA